MKVSIVGAGNAGVFTALYYSWYGRKKDLEVELIHDPNIPPEEVGQATLLGAPELISTKFNYYDNYIHATPKTGILYEGFGKVNEKFIHAFPTNTLAMHFCPCELQKFALESGRFNVVEDNVDPKDVDADYVFDCRGTPKDFTGYTPLKSPVNAAILGKPKWDSKELWSRHVATPDGWTFVIPTHPQSPSHDYCVGYCYNSNISSRAVAQSNFLEMFDVQVKHHVNFKNYVAKNAVIDDRIVLNGNRLFFLDPLESSSTQTYIELARFVLNNGVRDASNQVRRYIKQVQNFVLWHYNCGSKYDTPFWDYAKSLTFNDPEFDTILDASIKSSDYDIMDQANNNSRSGYGQWTPYAFKLWYDGMMRKEK